MHGTVKKEYVFYFTKEELEKLHQEMYVIMCKSDAWKEDGFLHRFYNHVGELRDI